MLTEMPGADETVDFARLFKAEDKSALKGGVDIVGAMFPRARSRFAGYVGLNEL